MQTLASQLSSTLVQLLFSFDRGMRVEKTLVQTLASQLSSTLMQLLFSFDQGQGFSVTLANYYIFFSVGSPSLLHFMAWRSIFHFCLVINTSILR